MVVAVLYLTLGLGMRPHPRSMLRAWLWLQVFVAVTPLIDWLLDSNYGYLRASRHRPASTTTSAHGRSTCSAWRRWPLVLFLACYAPFALLDRLRRGEGPTIPIEP